LKEVCSAENYIQLAVHNNLTQTPQATLAMLDLLTCTILPVKGLRHTTNGQDTQYLLIILYPAGTT
jgi:hypothetical protein